MKCRICGGSSFADVIDLGLMPLVNNLLRARDEGCPKYPLRVVACRSCSLAQLTEAPPPPSMFDDYCYFSSQSQTMVKHAAELVERFVRPGQFVVEIASNDGYLLRQAKASGARVLGVDPARNVAPVAEAAGVPTLVAYFNGDVARRIRKEHGPADVIFANNVLAHVPDPHEIADGIRELLAPHGVAHIEVPSIQRMLDLGAFDTIYHEHQCYFSLGALRTLFEGNDLVITAAGLAEIHGGSFHLRIMHRAGAEVGPALGTPLDLHAICEQECARGLFDERGYEEFRRGVGSLKQSLIESIDSVDTVAGYGAAAKAVVMLNAFGIDAERIPWVADVSPHKQGRFIPGTRQPIVAPSALLERMPDACVLFPWNLAEEVAGRNAAYLDRGGRFIVPIPRVRWMGREAAVPAGAGGAR